MFYQTNLDYPSLPKQFWRESLSAAPLLERINRTHQQLLESKLLLQNLFSEQVQRKNKTSKPKFTSKNSIWDTVKLMDRFSKPEYQSRQAKIDLLSFDANHFAREMALVETITRFSYWHSITDNETLGDGYSEDLSLMLNTFAQDLAKNGFSSSRATVETVSFENAKKLLTQIAVSGQKKAVLITSFPDDTEAGYHGVDSKHNWNTPETHHSFFYLLQVGDIKRGENNKVTNFEIKTTQYRAWPNAIQALEIHTLLGKPVVEQTEPIPNLLFANLIELDEDTLKKLVSEKIGQTALPIDIYENSLECLFRQFLYQDSDKHIINHTHSPEVPLEEFWRMQKLYLEQFYLEIAIPVFEEISKIKSSSPELDTKTIHEIQEKIDYLDKAFFYYSKILMGWIKINNSNPNYIETFKEKSQLQKILQFQQKVLLRLLGQKQTDEIPSVVNLKKVLEIDHRLATNQQVSKEDKQSLLKIWGFFSYVGSFSSLLQCGSLTPFTLPISIMNKSFTAGESLSQFSTAISVISIPEKQQLLELLKNEKYVELDLTKNTPSAKRVYVVPESYLQGNSCIVDINGAVLGPCINPETGERISLDDPADTLAFPMNMSEFTKYIETLQKNIEKESLSELDTLFQTNEFSPIEKRKAQQAIKKLRQKLIKKTLCLQDFFTGDLTNQEFYSNNEWLKQLLLKLSFSTNPIELLILEVERKLKEKDPTIDSLAAD